MSRMVLEFTLYLSASSTLIAVKLWFWRSLLSAKISIACCFVRTALECLASSIKWQGFRILKSGHTIWVIFNYRACEHTYLEEILLTRTGLRFLKHNGRIMWIIKSQPSKFGTVANFCWIPSLHLLLTPFSNLQGVAAGVKNHSQRTKHFLYP